MERKRTVWPPKKPGEAPGAPDSASLGEDRKSREGGEVEGEGSYSGTRDYNKRTEEFLKSGKLDKGARGASPQSEQEGKEMEKAERAGKRHAKGEDPALRKK